MQEIQISKNQKYIVQGAAIIEVLEFLDRPIALQGQATPRRISSVIDGLVLGLKPAPPEQKDKPGEPPKK